MRSFNQLVKGADPVQVHVAVKVVVNVAVDEHVDVPYQVNGIAPILDPRGANTYNPG